MVKKAGMPCSGVFPVDVHDLRHHQKAHEHQCRCLRRHHVDQRGEEDAEQEPGAGDQRRDTRPSALTDTGGRLDVASVDDTEPTPPAMAAMESTSRISLRARRVAVVGQQVTLGTDRDDGAHRVEEVAEQQREHEQQQTQHHRGAAREGAEQINPTEQGEVRRAELTERGHVEHPAGGVVVGLAAQVQHRLDDHREHCARQNGEQDRCCSGVEQVDL